MTGAPARDPAAYPGALLLWWGWTASSALLLGAPLANFAAAAFAQYPAGDAVAFQPGGWHLLEFLQRSGDSLRSVGAGTAFGLVALLIGSEVPIATFVAQRATRSSLLQAWSKAWGQLPWLALGGIVTRLLQALLIFLAWVSGSFLSSAFLGSASEPLQTLAALLWSMAPLVSIAAAGVVRDVWRAQLLGPRVDSLSALSLAVEVCRSRTLSLTLWWALPTAAGWSSVLALGYVVGELRVELPENWRWGSALLLHQVAIAALVYTRAVWSCAAIRAVEEA